MKILLVEDDKSFSKLLTDLLTVKWGHDVTIAGTGLEAVRQAESNEFDLVLLDIFLPDCQGHECIGPLRKKNKHIDIIAMTGRNNPDLELTVRAKGISYYMIKPFEISDLKAVLDHLIMKGTMKVRADMELQMHNGQ